VRGLEHGAWGDTVFVTPFKSRFFPAGSRGSRPWQGFIGANPPRNLARNMQAAWMAFAHTGDPSVPELLSWPAYDLERRATMIFHEASQVIDDPQAVERQAWDGVL